MEALFVARLALAVASAVVYTAVGYVVGRRHVSSEAEPAQRMFQLWWYGLAVLALFTPIIAILGLVGWDTFDVMLLLVHVLLVVVFAAIAGLVYYLLFLYTGGRWVMGAVAVYFFAMVVWLGYILVKAQLTSWGVPPDGGAKTFLNASGQEIVTDPLHGLLFGLLVAVPPLLSAGAFFLLYFRVKAPEQRYRIAMVAGSLAVWFGASLLGTVTGWSRADETREAWQLAQSVVTLCAACGVYAAYRPPIWIRRAISRPA